VCLSDLRGEGATFPTNNNLLSVLGAMPPAHEQKERFSEGCRPPNLPLA